MSRCQRMRQWNRKQRRGEKKKSFKFYPQTSKIEAWLELPSLAIPDGILMLGCFWTRTAYTEVIAQSCLLTSLSLLSLDCTIALHICALLCNQQTLTEYFPCIKCYLGWEYGMLLLLLQEFNGILWEINK